MKHPEASGASTHEAGKTAAGGDIDTLVYAAQVEMLYALTPHTLLMAVLFSTIVVSVLAPVVPVDKLALWYAANNIVSGCRYWLIRRYRRAQPAPAAAGQWARPFILLTALAGSIWGLMGTWLYTAGNPVYQGLIIVMLVGTSAVGLFTLHSLVASYAALCLPMLLPVAAYLFVLGDDVNVFLGFALLLFVLIAMSNMRRHQRNTVELLRLRFVNARIAEEREFALRTAEHASRVKSQFLATMSHEMRTPLSGILGMTQLLSGSKLDDEQRYRLDLVQRSGNHLLVLINDILDFSKIEAGRVTIERAPFDLRGAVSDVSNLLAPIAQDKGISLDVGVDADVPRWVAGDAPRVKQVLHNLIGNAVKFTDRGSVRATVRRDTATGGRWLRFEVQDTGRGIPAAQIDAIFDAFRQVDGSSTRRYGGTGLGLTISRELARAMGGDVGCRSEPGRGSTFWFTAELPETAAPEGARAKDEVRPPDAALLAGRVLLAEDNPVNALVARAMLEELGLLVDSVENGSQALERAIVTDYDLILMDCQMPEMDGYEATRRIRAHENASGSGRRRVVAVTANAVRGDRERCIEAGMDDYLAKPFLLADMRSVVERNLRPAAPQQRGG